MLNHRSHIDRNPGCSACLRWLAHRMERSLHCSGCYDKPDPQRKLDGQWHTHVPEWKQLRDKYGDVHQRRRWHHYGQWNIVRTAFGPEFLIGPGWAFNFQLDDIYDRHRAGVHNWW